MVVALTNTKRKTGAYTLGSIAADRNFLITTDAFRPVAAYSDFLVAADLLQSRGSDDHRFFSPDGHAEIVLDGVVHVFLSVQVDLLLSHLVFEAKFVRSRCAAAFTASRDDPGACAVFWQRILRHVGSVIDRADDDRIVWISIDELNDDLIVGSRPEEGPPAIARPRLSYAQPRTVGSVGLAFSIPEELNTD